MFFDEFSGNFNDWQTTSYTTDLATIESNVENGVLIISASYTENSTVWVPIPDIWLKDFLLSVEVQLVEVPIGSRTDVSIIFRLDNEGNHYVVNFGNNNQIRVRLCIISNGACSWQIVQDWQYTEALNLSQNKINKLQVAVKDGSFSIAVNDEQISEIAPVSITSYLNQSGSIALGIWGMAGTTASVEFDNVMISEIP